MSVTGFRRHVAHPSFDIDTNLLDTSMEEIRYRMLRLSLASVFVSGLAFAAPVVVFNDFGPGNGFMPGPGTTVGCGALCFIDAGHSHEWSFTPATTTSLSLLETVGSLGPSAGGTMIFTISADVGGVPGASLESFSLPLIPVQQFVAFASTLHPTLVAG